VPFWCRNAVEKRVFQMVYTIEEGVMDSSYKDQTRLALIELDRGWGITMPDILPPC
jgi:hypothetical protein